MMLTVSTVYNVHEIVNYKCCCWMDCSIRFWGLAESLM